MLARRAVKLREHTEAFRLGKVTAAAFYITLAQAFGSKRHTMIPKVCNSLLCVQGKSIACDKRAAKATFVDGLEILSKSRTRKKRNGFSPGYLYHETLALHTLPPSPCPSWSYPWHRRSTRALSLCVCVRVCMHVYVYLLSRRSLGVFPSTRQGHW